MPNPFLCHAHFVDECAIIYPTLGVTSVGVKRNNFLLERMIFLFRLLLQTRKRKEAAMNPARKEMPELQRQITKYVVKIDKLFQTLMCLLQMNKLEKSASTILLKKGFFFGFCDIFILYLFCFQVLSLVFCDQISISWNKNSNQQK